MSSLELLASYLAEHQARENELRRLQNCVARDNPVMYVGVVDATDSDLAVPTDSPRLRKPHFGMIPVSSLAPSNWTFGADHPFASTPETGIAVAHDPASGDIRRDWMTFQATATYGFLVVHPNGDRVFTRWEDEGSLANGQIFFRAFPGLMQALAWANARATEHTLPSS